MKIEESQYQNFSIKRDIQVLISSTDKLDIEAKNFYVEKGLQKMKIMSISDIAISAIENEDKIKLMILREKWKELFSELAEISTVIDFNEKIIYIKSYDSVLKHYIFANKQKLIDKIMESLEIKFEIEDIKIKS